MTPEEVAKVRELLTHKDPDIQRQGLELAKSFGDYSAVFEGCSINEEGKIKLSFGWLNRTMLEGLLQSGSVDVPSLDLEGEHTDVDVLAVTQIIPLLSSNQWAHVNQAFLLYRSLDSIEVGKALVQSLLNDVTNHDLAISENDIGIFEGDWDLELSIGAYETEVESCSYAAGDATWEGGIVYPHGSTTIKFFFSSSNPDALREIAACIRANYWDSSNFSTMYHAGLDGAQGYSSVSDEQWSELLNYLNQSRHELMPWCFESPDSVGSRTGEWFHYDSEGKVIEGKPEPVDSSEDVECEFGEGLYPQLVLSRKRSSDGFLDGSKLIARNQNNHAIEIEQKVHRALLLSLALQSSVDFSSLPTVDLDAYDRELNDIKANGGW